MWLTENILSQLITVFGGILATLIASITGYIIWKLKHEKTVKEEKEKEKEDQRRDREAFNATIIGRLDKIEDKVDRLYDYQSDNAEAISLIFESDIIQFQAFRGSHLLNGESERQEKKLRDFMENRLKKSMKPQNES